MWDLARSFERQPGPRLNGPASSLDGNEMVNLEGGTLGDASVPVSVLREIIVPAKRLFVYECADVPLFYRPIGVDTDRPRVFAFHEFASHAR